jgi:hypothetical protein
VSAALTDLPELLFLNARGLPDLLKARREVMEARWLGEMAARMAWAFQDPPSLRIRLRASYRLGSRGRGR